MSQFISLEDLIIAYRKVKVDTFYDTGHLTSQAFTEYENNLIRNLEVLCDRINAKDLHWFGEKYFVGDYYCCLKSVDINYKSNQNDLIFYTNSKLIWNSIKSVKPDFRLIGMHSVDFHVFSSLWIEKVGLYLEKKINDNSYGCRLRHDSNESNISGNGYENKQNTLGHFRSYLNDYQRWQNNGIEEITKAIENKKKVVAITSDLKKYYHRIDSSFIADQEFLKSIELSEYSELQTHLNEILVHAIASWSKMLYDDLYIPSDFKYNGHCGIPMGLGAAKVIANLLMIFLDKKIETEIKPIYYGRYVDDIFLVLEDGDNLENSLGFWSFIKKRIKEIVNPSSINRKKRDNKIDEYKPTGYILKIPYAGNSLIEFGKDKEKFFFLEGISGKSFLETLKESLEENSSEWKLPPNTENDLESFSKAMSGASSDHKESASSLRKSDGVSIRRQKFILYLKRFEIAIQLLPPEHWYEPIKKFFDLMIEFTITPGNIATYSKYYSRIVGLAIKSNNLNYAIKTIECLDHLFEKLKDVALTGDADKRNQIIVCLDKAKKYQNALLIEGIYQNFYLSDKNSPSAQRINDILASLGDLSFDIVAISQRFFSADLHSRPFKDAFLYPPIDLNDINELSSFYNSLMGTSKLPNLNDWRRVVQVIWKKVYPENTTIKYPFGLYFFTRPLTLIEFSLLFPTWHNIENIFKAACQIFNIDFQPNSYSVFEMSRVEDLKAIVLNAPRNNLNKVVAFTSLETKNESWIAVVREDGAEPDINREQRILDLCANIIKCKKIDVDYVLFPELSIPRKLLLYLSNIFFKKRISIIAGLEYEITKYPKHLLPGSGVGYVSNQLIYILCVPGRYTFQHISIIQEKVIPAQEEERQLLDIGGKYMRADDETKYLISHGGFWFSGLICNDFLDINNRAILRGFVDALIVVEWNKDINTYNALVESSANDIHCFILQINNRLYGDTRLRGPYKEEYERDKVRVRGGELDYFVVATLQVKEIREFQRNFRSPEKPFKPVPTGFQLSDQRKNDI